MYPPHQPPIALHHPKSTIVHQLWVELPAKAAEKKYSGKLGCNQENCHGRILGAGRLEYFGENDLYEIGHPRPTGQSGKKSRQKAQGKESFTSSQITPECKKLFHNIEG